MLGLLAQSCLLPQSIESVDSREHIPPRIRVESIPSNLLIPILPLTRTTSQDKPTCHCELPLTIPVIEEDDPTVDVLVRWFVDYNKDDPLSVRPVKVFTWTGTFDRNELTRGPETYAFEPDGAAVSTNGIHIIEIVVGDAAGFDDVQINCGGANPSPGCVLPNRTMKPGYVSDVYRFAVDIENATGSNCDATLPARRVCQ